MFVARKGLFQLLGSDVEGLLGEEVSGLSDEGNLVEGSLFGQVLA
ncbi:hypothetical protein [Schaalia canis]|nr:hypothetical protein [Schaalia canis]